MAVDQSYFQAEICRNFNSLDDQHATRGIGVVIQGRNQCGAACGQDGEVILGDGDCLLIGLDNINANNTQSGRRTVRNGIGELVGTRSLGNEIYRSQFKIGSNLATRGCNRKGN